MNNDIPVSDGIFTVRNIGTQPADVKEKAFLRISENFQHSQEKNNFLPVFPPLQLSCSQIVDLIGTLSGLGISLF